LKVVLLYITIETQWGCLNWKLLCSYNDTRLWHKTFSPFHDVI